MTIEQIKNTITLQIQSGVFEFNAVFFAQIGMDISFCTDFNLNVTSSLGITGGTISISNLTSNSVSVSGTNDLIISTGKVNWFGSDLSVDEIWLSVSDNKASLVICVSLPTDWSLQNHFTMLNGYPGNSLLFSNSKYIFSSLAQTSYTTKDNAYLLTLSKGLNFTCNVNPSQYALVGNFLTFSGITNSLTANYILTGTIEPNPVFVSVNDTNTGENISYPVINLKTQKLIDGTINSFPIKNISSPYLILCSNKVDKDTALDYSPTIALGFVLNISTISLDVIVALNKGSRIYNLTVIPKEILVSDLISIVPLFSDIWNQTDFIPKFIQDLLQTIKLEGLNVQFYLGDTPAIISIGASIGTEAWYPFETLTTEIKVESIQLVWNCLSPMGGESLRKNKLNFLGVLSLYELEFKIGISSDKVVSGSCYGNFSLAALINNTFSEANITLPFNADFTEFDIYLDLTNNCSWFGATGDIETEFIDLSLTNCRFEVGTTYSKVNNVVEKTFSVAISGVVNICGIHCSVEGTYQKQNDNSSWNFSGSSYEGQQIHISSFITYVQNKFGLTISLPNALSSCSISNVKLSHQSDTGETNFDFEIDSSFTLSDVLSELNLPTDLKSKLTNQGTKLNVNLKKDTSGSYNVNVVLRITDEIHLNTLLGLSENLSGSFNPQLNSVTFEIDINNGNQTKTVQQNFTANFSNSGSTKIICFKGIHYTSKKNGLVTESCLGGNIYCLDGSEVDFDELNLPIDIQIKDLFIAKVNGLTILGSDLSAHANIDLSSLPVVGGFLKQAKLDFNSLRILYVSNDVAPANLTTVNTFLTKLNVAAIVVPQSSVANNTAVQAGLKAGFNLQGVLLLGEDGKQIPLYSSLGKGSAPTSGTPAAASGTNTGGVANPPAGNANANNAVSNGGASTGNTLDANNKSKSATPTPVGKKFGPITVQSIGIGLSGGKVKLDITGALQIGPLGLDFIGFEISSPINDFNPSIDLQGLGINISKPPLTLEGLFSKSSINIPTTDSSGNTTTVAVTGYNGTLSIGYKEYSLKAMGSYAQLPSGATSVFIYGFLGAPLGGLPGILFITGVAAGFGYNRSFTLPSPDGVGDFSLIKLVDPSNTSPVDFDTVNQQFLPTEGSFWGAVGVRVESFKMITTFVLLVVRVENELEIDIVGKSTMQFPVPNPTSTSSSPPPLAKVLIGVVARILPERGVLAINGAFLAGSYIYVPEAQITGGFAVLSIFKNQHGGQWDTAKEGDFILTLGGYGPYYTPKSYYPQVPRMELNWKVSDNLSVKADAYFAITPEAMMFGGHLSASFNSGGSFSIHVNFSVGADFIIYWKPYRYKAHMYAELSVTATLDVDLWLFTIHVSVDFDLSADLTIWGPSFSGYASVHVHVLVSFTVGISFGEAEQLVLPIGWNDFETGFLPAEDKVLTCNVGKGVIASQSSDTYTVVNAKELSIVCGTAIPIQEVAGVISLNATVNSFGIKNMGNTSYNTTTKTGDFSESTFTISINKDGAAVTAEEIGHFNFVPITKNLPSALWQSATTSGQIPANDGTEIIEGLLTGIIITTVTTLPADEVVISVGGLEDDILTPPINVQRTFTYS